MATNRKSRPCPRRAQVLFKPVTSPTISTRKNSLQPCSSPNLKCSRMSLWFSTTSVRPHLPPRQPLLCRGTSVQSTTLNRRESRMQSRADSNNFYKITKSGELRGTTRKLRRRRNWRTRRRSLLKRENNMSQRRKKRKKIQSSKIGLIFRRQLVSKIIRLRLTLITRRFSNIWVAI